MLRCVTLLVLLATTWTQQAVSTKCGDKCTSKEHGELYSFLDNIGTTINNILQSEKHKKIVQDLIKKVKSKIQDLEFNANEMSDIRKLCEYFLTKLQYASLTEKDIIGFLNTDPMKRLDSFIKSLKSTQKKEH
ncbi:hypothetical protein GDO81_022258 [Engystomops pustulosus]|uniref:Uncharacterized protein n=1 Tax=Engystomops pustulosus TaxID=76066 RepID=A0AAV6Z8S9_ENGPU|nr:hypothetical protein GDO81_022258 [Engystomops pustulosus]